MLPPASRQARIRLSQHSCKCQPSHRLCAWFLHRAGRRSHPESWRLLRSGGASRGQLRAAAGGPLAKAVTVGQPVPGRQVDDKQPFEGVLQDHQDMHDLRAAEDATSSFRMCNQCTNLDRSKAPVSMERRHYAPLPSYHAPTLSLTAGSSRHGTVAHHPGDCFANQPRSERLSGGLQ